MNLKILNELDRILKNNPALKSNKHAYCQVVNGVFDVELNQIDDTEIHALAEQIDRAVLKNYFGKVWQAETKKFKYSIKLLKRKDSVSKHNAGRLVTENIYTGKEMDMVTSHLFEYWFEGDNIINYISVANDMAELEDNIYSLLWSLNGIKRMNTKLLVVFGWDNGLPDGCKDKMINFFGLNSIATIEPSILDWTLEQGYEQSSSYHPNKEGYKAFTEEVLEPKLKSLGWI